MKVISVMLFSVQHYDNIPQGTESFQSTGRNLVLRTAMEAGWGVLEEINLKYLAQLHLFKIFRPHPAMVKLDLKLKIYYTGLVTNGL